MFLKELAYRGQNSDPLEVSTHLVKNHSKEWLTAMEDAFVIIGAILSIIHPEQFKAGCETLELLLRRSAEIRRGDELVEIIPLWGTPFSVISAICNRETPFHRDNGSAYPWYDFIVALGEYMGGSAEFPGLGCRLRYNPGTMISHLGRVLRHGVACPGDRACLAFYMRENVVKEMGVGGCEWMNVSHYSAQQNI